MLYLYTIITYIMIIFYNSNNKEITSKEEDKILMGTFFLVGYSGLYVGIYNLLI